MVTVRADCPDMEPSEDDPEFEAWLDSRAGFTRCTKCTVPLFGSTDATLCHDCTTQ